MIINTPKGAFLWWNDFKLFYSFDSKASMLFYKQFIELTINYLVFSNSLIDNKMIVKAISNKSEIEKMANDREFVRVINVDLYSHYLGYHDEYQDRIMNGMLPPFLMDEAPNIKNYL